MTDILCPVCGKPNLPEAEACQFCDAPLKTSAFTPDFDEESDLPDWLRSLNADQSAFPVSGPAEEQPSVPDWLRGMGSEIKADQPEEIPAQPAEDKPDWLSDLIKQEPGEPLSADLPDWLSQENALPTPPFSDEEQDWSSNLFGERSTEQQEAVEKPQAEQPTSSMPAFSFDAFEHPETPAKELENSDDVLSTLPDWVANVTAEEEEQVSTEGEGELAPAQLPSWVEAMRPSEVEHPSGPVEDLSGATAENSGPLIGLRGVLSAEPVKIRARRASAYSIKLRVTDEQKQRVALLEQLLANEPKPKSLPAAPIITAQYIFRLVIALALLLPVLWAVISNGQVTPMPDASAVPGVMAMYNIVQRLPENAPVLVAFDYEAGYTGEMDSAASAILEHLIARNAYLTLASTSATGPALAERFMGNLNQPRYANLGYIPGGSIGLFSLANSLRQTLPYDLQGVDIWSLEPLSSVNSATDFELILVLVSDPEVARSWIEQVAPLLNQDDAAMAVIASAQTTPLVQPYFAGFPRQIDGLVSGVSGGAAYESVSNHGGQARLTWDAYSLGLLVSVFIILIGAALDVSYKALRPEKKGK